MGLNRRKDGSHLFEYFKGAIGFGLYPPTSSLAFWIWNSTPALPDEVGEISTMEALPILRKTLDSLPFLILRTSTSRNCELLSYSLRELIRLW